MESGPFAGNRNGTGESGATRRNCTASPAHTVGISTANRFDALSTNQQSNKKHKTLEDTGPTESGSQE